MAAHYSCGLGAKPHGPHRFRALIMWSVVSLPCPGNLP